MTEIVTEKIEVTREVTRTKCMCDRCGEALGHDTASAFRTREVTIEAENFTAYPGDFHDHDGNGTFHLCWTCWETIRDMVCVQSFEQEER